jgi:hypothetical protein
MASTILHIIVETVLILAGLFWMLIVLWGTGMADRQVDFWSETAGPMAIGLLPIGIAITMIFW